MSKIANDSLTRSGTGCFIAVPIWYQWASKGLKEDGGSFMVSSHLDCAAKGL